jgi:hypothetical protein
MGATCGSHDVPGTMRTTAGKYRDEAEHSCLHVYMFTCLRRASRDPSTQRQWGGHCSRVTRTHATDTSPLHPDTEQAI